MRNADSHKGENGKVCIVGGSKMMHGAPLFAALSAEASGVDLVHICLPSCHRDVAKMQSLNFQVVPFADDELTAKDVPMILQLLAVMDVLVIGPGLARTSDTLKAVAQLIAGCPCPLVVDASALQKETLQWCAGKSAVLTPHLGELERMGIAEATIGATAKEFGVTIHVKGSIDHIAAPDGTMELVKGGNAGLTVGGTGDALAGLIAGLMAQGTPPPEACMKASTIIKAAGDRLQKTHGFSYTTRQVIDSIAHV